MDKNYLLEEVIESLGELAPFSDAVIIHASNEDKKGLKKTLKEAELIVEHLASCLVALKKAIK